MRCQRLLCIGVTMSALVLQVSSQNPGSKSPPPPPPKTVKADAKGLYESKLGGFKVAFPSDPVVSTRDTETSYGQTKVTTYTLLSTLAAYVVVHLDFPTAIKDKFDLDTRFDSMRDIQMKTSSSRLISETELFFGDNYGRDIVIANDKATTWTRAFVVGQRLFGLTVVTPGNFPTQSTTLKTSNEERVKKFYNSFVVTNIPKPLLEVVELPSDFGVTTTGSTFSSSALGVSFQTPAEWKVVETGDADALFEIGKDEVSRTQPKLAEHLRSTETNRLLLTVSKTELDRAISPAIMTVIVERVSYPNFLPISVAENFSRYLGPSHKVVMKPTLQKLGGVEFAVTETQNSESKSYLRVFFANRRGMCLEFSLVYKDKGDLNVMLRSLETLAFDK